MKRKNKIVYSPTVYGLYSNVAKRFNFPDWLTPSYITSNKLTFPNNQEVVDIRNKKGRH